MKSLFSPFSLTRDSFQLMNSRLYFNEHQMIRCIRWFRTHFRTHAIDLSSRVHKYLTMRCHSNFWTFFTRERKSMDVFTHRMVFDSQTHWWYLNNWLEKNSTIFKCTCWICSYFQKEKDQAIIDCFDSYLLENANRWLIFFARIKWMFAVILRCVYLSNDFSRSRSLYGGNDKSPERKKEDIKRFYTSHLPFINMMIMSYLFVYKIHQWILKMKQHRKSEGSRPRAVVCKQSHEWVNIKVIQFPLVWKKRRRRKTLTTLWLVWNQSCYDKLFSTSAVKKKRWKKQERTLSDEIISSRLNNRIFVLMLFSRSRWEFYCHSNRPTLCVCSKGNDRHEDDNNKVTKWACIKIISYRQRHVREDEHLTWQNLIKIFSRLDYEQSADNEKRERKSSQTFHWLDFKHDRSNKRVHFMLVQLASSC